MVTTARGTSDRCLVFALYTANARLFFLQYQSGADISNMDTLQEARKSYEAEGYLLLAFPPFSSSLRVKLGLKRKFWSGRGKGT